MRNRRSRVPKKVPMIAPASVPPEYCPEHVVDDCCVNTVVVACRGTRAGVAGKKEDARVGAIGRLYSSVERP